MRVMAIDPGTTNTGVVILKETEDIIMVDEVKTIHYRSAIKNDQRELLIRSKCIFDEIASMILESEPDKIVIEGFISFGSRRNVYVSQTPFLVGALCLGMVELGRFPNIQLSRDVLSKPMHMPKSEYPPMVSLALEEVIDAKHACTNEHLRSALAHGYYFIKKVRNDE